MQPKKKTYNFFMNCFHHLRSTSLEVCNLLIISVKLQLHDAIYRLRFYSNSLVHILSLSNSHNNVASIQKNWGDKSHRVIVALENVGSLILSPETILNDNLFKNFQTMTAINASHDTLNNSNLPAFLYKCDTMTLLR